MAESNEFIPGWDVPEGLARAMERDEGLREMYGDATANRARPDLVGVVMSEMVKAGEQQGCGWKGLGVRSGDVEVAAMELASGALHGSRIIERLRELARR